MACPFRINIDKVEESLRAVQGEFAGINETLEMSREELRSEILLNMMAGYRYINYIIENDINLLHRRGFPHLLELNNMVLCGPNLHQRADFRNHIEETSVRFYEQRGFSIKNIRTWAEKNSSLDPYKLAAGIFIMQISRPQLFIEGNHRTGVLLMSTILVRRGKPPFVLTPDNAKAFFDPSSLAKGIHKNFLGKLYKLPKITENFARFLEEHAKKEFLLRL